MVACLLAGKEITEIHISTIICYVFAHLPVYYYCRLCLKKIVSLSVCYDSLPNLTHKYVYINMFLILWDDNFLICRKTRSGVLHLCLDALRNYASRFLIIAVIIIVSKPFWFYLSI